MLDIVIGVCGILVGLVAAWLYYRSAGAVLVERLAERDRHIQQADADLKAARDQVDALLTENTSLKTKSAGLTATLDEERKSAEERLTTAQQTAAARQADNEKAAGERLAVAEKA